jgi:hypothetical protein
MNLSIVRLETSQLEIPTSGVHLEGGSDDNYGFRLGLSVQTSSELESQLVERKIPPGGRGFRSTHENCTLSLVKRRRAGV